MLVSTGAIGACASTTQFSRDIQAHHWTDAAIAFDKDSSLHNNEQALYQAALLHSFPNRDTYDPLLARALFRRLLSLYPRTQMRQSAIDHIALLQDIQYVHDTTVQHERATQAKIAQLVNERNQLKVRIDSLISNVQDEKSQNVLLRKIASRLEDDLQNREDQLRVLNAELARLKEIDLKPLRNGIGGDTARRVRKR